MLRTFGGRSADSFANPLRPRSDRRRTRWFPQGQLHLGTDVRLARGHRKRGRAGRGSRCPLVSL